MELSLNEFVLLIIFGSLIVVAFASAISRFLHHRREFRVVSVRITCRLCGNVFISAHSGKLCHCSSCDALNLHKGNGKLG